MTHVSSGHVPPALLFHVLSINQAKEQTRPTWAGAMWGRRRPRGERYQTPLPRRPAALIPDEEEEEEEEEEERLYYRRERERIPINNLQEREQERDLLL